ncbi:MAG: conjugal transfer protein TraG [Geobacter sp.]|nr:MAG: conjugal transfer protein TraG [Geobacter sp.]
MVYIDPKVDQDIASKIVQVAVSCGREDDLMFINTVFPEYSAFIDPMAYYFIYEELVEHCVAGIKEGKDPFYRNVGKELVGAVINALTILNKANQDTSEGNPPPTKLRINLQDVKERMSRADLEDLKQQLSGLTTREAQDAENDLQRIIATGEEYYSKVASSLRCALMDLTTGNIGKIIGQATENRFLKRLEENKPVILVCQLGSQIVHDAAFTLGKVVLSMIQSFIGRIYSSNRKKVNPPLCVHIDEAHEVIHPGMETMCAQARGADCAITVYSQSINQFEDKLGKEGSRSMLSHFNSKIFMRSPDADTADYVAKHFGTVKKFSSVLGQGSISSREVEEDVIKAFDVQSLRAREFFMLSYSDDKTKGRWKGRTGDTSKAWLEVEYPAAPVD